MNRAPMFQVGVELLTGAPYQTLPAKGVMNRAPMFQVGMELLTGAPYHITTPVMAMVFVLYGIMCCVLSPQVQVRITKISIVVLGLSMAAVVIAAGVYVLSDMIKCQ